MTHSRRRKVVGFLGAGASTVAQLPTVNQFFSNVHWPAGRQAQGFELVSRDLARKISVTEDSKEHLSWPTYDAEKLLGHLELLATAERIVTVDQVPMGGATNLLKLPVDDLLQFLKKEIVRIYDARKFIPSHNSQPPHQALFSVLDRSTPQNEPLQIFTTNYDTLVEGFMRSPVFTNDAFKDSPRLCSGFTDGRPGFWKSDLFKELPRPSERLIQFIKLHGSVTWKWDPASGLPVDTGWGGATGDSDCLLHLGYKSFPEREPFRTLHHLLKTVILQPATVVAVGFRFGDPYILETFDFALRANSGLKIVCCLTKTPPNGTPLDRLLKDFPGQVELLLGTGGKPVPFGDSNFKSALETVLHQLE